MRDVARREDDHVWFDDGLLDSVGFGAAVSGEVGYAVGGNVRGEGSDVDGPRGWWDGGAEEEAADPCC